MHREEFLLWLAGKALEMARPEELTELVYSKDTPAEITEFFKDQFGESGLTDEQVLIDGLNLNARKYLRTLGYRVHANG